LSDDQRNKLQIAEKHADELGVLIEHFFEYSYYLHAEPEPNRERINLTNLVTDCLAESIADFKEKKIVVHIEENVPVYACADKERVNRIIQYLIRNCAAHSDGDLEVHIRTEQNAVISFRNHVKNAYELDVTGFLNVSI
jgi:signal transduction histidine kinase